MSAYTPPPMPEGWEPPPWWGPTSDTGQALARGAGHDTPARRAALWASAWIEATHPNATDGERLLVGWVQDVRSQMGDGPTPRLPYGTPERLQVAPGPAGQWVLRSAHVDTDNDFWTFWLRWLAPVPAKEAP